MTSVYDIQALETLCRDPYQRKKLCNAYFKKALPPKECADIAPELNELLFHTFKRMEQHHSKRDGATKLVFETEDDCRVEAVILRIASGRTSLCISSQVGCAADCQFCATGKLGFIRNLTAAEMLDQVLLAKRLLREEGRTLRNVVVMGMGEPLRNEANLFQCLETLRDPRFFNLSENHLLVSTVGIPDAMLRFKKRFPNIQLALSLHSARQDVRERIMPVAKFQTLEKLKAIFPLINDYRLTGTVRPTSQIQRFSGRANRPGEPGKVGKTVSGFMIEYLMLKGVNDGPDDLAALIDFLQGTKAHINLIQFNAYPGAPFEPVSPETRKAFGDELKKAGFKTTLRYSLGDDIAAACGQLAGK